MNLTKRSWSLPRPLSWSSSVAAKPAKDQVVDLEIVSRRCLCAAEAADAALYHAMHRDDLPALQPMAERF